MRRDRLLSAAVALVQTGRVLNLVAVAVLSSAIFASFVAAPTLEARLLAKYGAGVDPAAILTYLRATLLFTYPTGLVVELMLRALHAILATVGAGEPFASANAARLRAIGWLLLALQLIDLAFGASTLFADRLRIDIVTWQPSFTGWFAVLVAFVLVRVFAAGTALRDDLDGTV